MEFYGTLYYLLKKYSALKLKSRFSHQLEIRLIKKNRGFFMLKKYGMITINNSFHILYTDLVHLDQMVVEEPHPDQMVVEEPDLVVEALEELLVEDLAIEAVAVVVIEDLVEQVAN